MSSCGLWHVDQRSDHDLLEVFSDSDWAGKKDSRRSTNSGGAECWDNKEKQNRRGTARCLRAFQRLSGDPVQEDNVRGIYLYTGHGLSKATPPP
ncbi:unnamed protein product [Symbiodinium sp. KB8]|nr:unnamed protein product [Symbiodinium sp. KB8]